MNCCLSFSTSMTTDFNSDWAFLNSSNEWSTTSNLALISSWDGANSSSSLSKATKMISLVLFSAKNDSGTTWTFWDLDEDSVIEATLLAKNGTTSLTKRIRVGANPLTNSTIFFLESLMDWVEVFGALISILTFFKFLETNLSNGGAEIIVLNSSPILFNKPAWLK